MTERFLLQKSRKKPKGWVCTDTKYNIVCQFEEHKYKETRQYHLNNQYQDDEL